MYARVIPAVRLPKSFGAYDYAVPDRYRSFVVRGSWVVVPWRGRPVAGLVMDLDERTSVPTERIREILGFGNMSPLKEDLIQLPERMARHYLTSPSSALKSFLPHTPKTKIEQPAEDSSPPPPQETNQNEVGLQENLLLRYSNLAEKEAEVIRLVRQAAEIRDRGSIVVTPHVAEIEELAKTLSDQTDLPVIRLHGGLTPAKIRTAWKTVIDGPPSVIVGTRLAALAPLPYPGLLLALESESQDLRQYDQNPRYDVRDLLTWRSELSSARLVFMSHAPRLEEYRLAGLGKLSRPTIAPAEPETILVDLSGNPHGQSTPLSLTVLDRLRQSLQNERKVLVFHNRLGSAGGLFCRPCRQPLRCPTCEIALGVNRNELRCSRCGHRSPRPTGCPLCRKPELVEVGQGTRTIRTSLQEEFPESSVLAYDSDLLPEDRPPTLDGADILIGTNLLLHDLAELRTGREWGCLIVPRLDDLLAFPGYRVTEEAWRTIRTLKDLAAESSAPLLLQTLDPESPRIRTLLLPEDDFVQTELRERESSGYPPFGTLLTVTVRHRDQATAKRLAEGLLNELRPKISPAETRLAGPIRHRQPRRDGLWRYVVVLRTRPNLPEPIRSVLTGLPENYIVDRNPETVG